MTACLLKRQQRVRASLCRSPVTFSGGRFCQIVSDSGHLTTEKSENTGPAAQKMTHAMQTRLALA